MSYKEFALSDDASSLSKSAWRTLPLRILKVGEGFASIHAASARATLDVPLGWIGGDRGDRAILATPDESVRFMLGFQQVSAGSDLAATMGLAKRSLAVELKGMSPEARVVPVKSPLPDSVAVKATGIVDSDGSRVSMLRVLIFGPAKPNFPLSVILRAPEQEFTRHARLLTLILRSLRVQWEERGMSDYIDRIKDQKDFESLELQVVGMLTTGNVDGLMRLLAPSVVRTHGQEFMRAAIERLARSYFHGFDRLGRSIHVIDYPAGNGYVFRQTFLDKGGIEKPFAIGVIREEGRVALADISIDDWRRK